jgi:hypothetical protein
VWIAPVTAHVMMILWPLIDSPDDSSAAIPSDYKPNWPRAFSLKAIQRRPERRRGHFPSDEAAATLIRLQLRKITQRWKIPREWAAAKAQFAIVFGDRFEVNPADSTRRISDSPVVSNGAPMRKSTPRSAAEWFV